MQQININVLKPHPRNNDFFDDLSGEEFERLKNSIRDEKIYTDILVSPDMTIISGHQRVRAAKELGMTLVPIKIDEDLQDEDSKLRALISNNFGRRKNDPEKDRKALAQYVALRGFKQGGDRKSKDQHGLLNLGEIAKELNISKTNLKRALSIERNLTDSMKQLLDDGVITKTLAADTIASLSEEEQLQLISSMNTTKKITQREVQKYIDEKRELENRVKQLENRPPEIKVVEKEKIIDKTDYSLKDKNNELSSRLSTIESEKQTLQLMNQTLKSSNETTKSLLEKYQKDSEEYRKFKSKMIDLGLEPDGNYNLAKAATEIAKLTNDIEDLLTNKLAPVKYQNFMIAVQSNDILKKNFSNTLHFVRDWYESMMTFAGIEDTTEEIIDMEEI